MSGIVLLVGVSPLLQQGFRSIACESGLDVLTMPQELSFSSSFNDAVLCVVQSNGGDQSTLDLVRRVSKLVGARPMVVLAKELRLSTVVRLVHLGVADVVDLPAPAEDVAVKAFQHAADPGVPVASEPIVGQSEAIRGVRRRVGAVAPTMSTVLIVGETGTGKGLVAKAIHDRSSRNDRAFIHVDCAALSPTIIESELFGHERGAFTGASELRRGRFELAEHGTIFLDEIGDLDMTLQAKLLRVLQDRTYERVGGTKTLRMSARVVAATNRDLFRLVQEGCFRPDLYYRLNVIEIRIPPLRARCSDVPVLVRTGLDELSARLGIPVPQASDGFYDRLMNYSWSGNVRELMNVLERCLVQLRVGTLEPEDLDGILDGVSFLGDDDDPLEWMPCDPQDLELDEARVLRKVLREVGGNVSRAARRLEIPRGTLRYRLKVHGLSDLIPRD